MENLSKRSQNKVDSIVQNARKLFVHKGYHKVTMESVAQYANVSKVTLYKYFKDKQALYEYLLVDIIRKEQIELFEIIDSRSPYKEKVLLMIKLILRKHYDSNTPIHDNSIVLGYETQKQIKKYERRMKTKQKKLYDQGRLEEYICDDVTDDTLDIYFDILTNGIKSEQKRIGDLEGERFQELSELLYKGIFGCQSY